MDTIKIGKTTHDKRGRFVKGSVPNPKGRPRMPEVRVLREALDKAKKKHGIHFLEHFVDWAYKNDKIAVALAKKLIPDKIEGKGFDTTNITHITSGEFDPARREGLIEYLRARQGKE